jgi:hypothetical protein
MIKNNTKRNFILAGGLVLVTIFLLSCNRNRRTTGWDYFPDMAYSTAYETFTKNPNFSDSMTMRVPEKGTVPQGFVPFNYTIEPESRAKAGEELTNPFLPTDELLEKGKHYFTAFCMLCHGPSGEGNGHLYTSGLYPMKPKALSGANAVVLKDGEIFHTITLGFGTMGSYGTQIKPDDRWMIILYIRKLQEEAGQASGSMEGK